jgi:hypothetical protein
MWKERRREQTSNGRSIIGAVVAPWLTQIKQVELYLKKWPYFPRQYWDKICPIPTYEVLSIVKQDRSDKNMAKQGGASGAPAAKSEAKQLREDAREQKKQEAIYESPLLEPYQN